MKTYLISITSDCEGVKENYLDTVDKVGDSAEIIMVSFRPYPIENKKVRQIQIDGTYPNNLRRFDYFPTGFEDDDMIIFTDASDVIFQCEIPKLDPKIIYLASENELWGGNNWWTDKLKEFNFTELDKSTIFNMGCWAMSYSNVKLLLGFIKENKGRFKDWCASDQVLFNWWLRNAYGRIETRSPFSPLVCLYNGFDQGKYHKENGKFYDEFNTLIPIVHGNGGIHKGLLIYKK